MSRPIKSRPDREEYFMRIAMEVRARANCLGTRVGAVLALEDRLISAGYNGVPSNMTNCEDGGCYRCAHREEFESGKAYDVCICVHAEQNALLSAARFGIPVQGAVLHTTSRPCFGCTKELLQAQIKAIYYLHHWEHPDSDLRIEYEKIQTVFDGRGGIRQVKIEDPDEDWAIPKKAVPEETGHTMPADDLKERIPTQPNEI